MVQNKGFQIAEGERLIIGRGADAGIQILDAGLSRHHCFLEKVGNDFYLADLNSRNGTFVNGQRITRVRLQSGDIISIGSIEFQFRCEPDRRRMQADLVAGVPRRAGGELKERVDLEHSELMRLPSEIQNVENYRRIQRDLATIYRVGNMINAETDLNRLYESVLDAIFQVIQADRAFIIMSDPRTGELRICARRESGEADRESLPRGFSTTVVNESFREGTSILRADVSTDERFASAESVIFQHIRSVMCVPIETPDRMLGVIYADNVARSESFARHDLELLTAIGRQAGVAIQRVQLAGQLQRLLRGAVSALVATIEAKDEYTRGHSERVTAYAMEIARTMALDGRRLDAIELAGFLHDVGKIAIPERILYKPASLTSDEYEIVRQHPRVGYDIVKNVEGADEIAEIVLHHHECWDGSGYPDGLAGEAPSLCARILAVADAFDAMTSKRPYREAMDRAEALHEIESGAGKKFDPNVAAAMINAARAGRLPTFDKD